jgi:hypothetical protein
MARSAHAQYTVRRVPRSVDRALRRLARERGQSLNAVLVEIVTRAAGVDADPRTHDDLDGLIGSWVSDPATNEALEEQRRVDLGDWKLAPEGGG